MTKPFVPTSFSGALDEWCRKLAEALRAIIDGNVEWSLDISLTPSATTTVITDPRIRATSALVLTPSSAASAVAPVYVSSQAAGTATLTHDSSGATRGFRVVVIG